jgi:hypothetical protein
MLCSAVQEPASSYGLSWTTRCSRDQIVFCTRL